MPCARRVGEAESQSSPELQLALIHLGHTICREQQAFADPERRCALKRGTTLPDSARDVFAGKCHVALGPHADAGLLVERERADDLCRRA